MQRWMCWSWNLKEKSCRNQKTLWSERRWERKRSKVHGEVLFHSHIYQEESCSEYLLNIRTFWNCERKKCSRNVADFLFFCNFSPFVYVDATGTLLSYQISWGMSKRIPKRTPKRLPKRLPKRMSKRISKRNWETVPNSFSAVGMGILVKQISETDDLIPDDQNGGHCYEMAHE